MSIIGLDSESISEVWGGGNEKIRASEILPSLTARAYLNIYLVRVFSSL